MTKVQFVGCADVWPAEPPTAAVDCSGWRSLANACLQRSVHPPASRDDRQPVGVDVASDAGYRVSPSLGGSPVLALAGPLGAGSDAQTLDRWAWLVLRRRLGCR